MPPKLQFRRDFWSDGAVAVLRASEKLLLPRLWHEADAEGILEAGRTVDGEPDPLCLLPLAIQVDQSFTRETLMEAIGRMLTEGLCFEYAIGRGWYLWFPTIAKFSRIRDYATTIHPRPPVDVFLQGVRKFPGYVPALVKMNHTSNPLPAYYLNGSTEGARGEPATGTPGAPTVYVADTPGPPGESEESSRAKPPEHCGDSRADRIGMEGIGRDRKGRKSSPPKSPSLPRGRLGSHERTAYLLIENSLPKESWPSTKKESRALQHEIVQWLENSEPVEMLAFFLEDFPTRKDHNGEPWDSVVRAFMLQPGYRKWREEVTWWDAETAERTQCPHCKTLEIPTGFTSKESGKEVEMCVVCHGVLNQDEEERQDP